jgi:hypothetical protein
LALAVNLLPALDEQNHVCKKQTNRFNWKCVPAIIAAPNKVSLNCNNKND